MGQEGSVAAVFCAELRGEHVTHPCTWAFASNRFKHINSAQSDMLLPNTCKQRTYKTFKNTEVAKADKMRNQMGD